MVIGPASQLTKAYFILYIIITIIIIMQRLARRMSVIKWRIAGIDKFTDVSYWWFILMFAGKEKTVNTRNAIQK